MNYLLLLVAVLLAGCSITSKVATKPLWGQSIVEHEADEEVCAGATDGMEKRERAYAACMIAQGYTATVPFTLWAPIGESDAGAHFEVTATTLRDAAAVRSDIEACRVQALDAAKQHTGAKVGTWIGIISGLGPAIQRDIVGDELRRCFEPRGYTLQPPSIPAMEH
jgi:hypothetical protein